MKMKKRGHATTMKKRRNATTPRACVQMWDLAGALVPDLRETDSAWIMGARVILFGLLLHIQKTQPGLTGEQMAREAARLVAEADYDQLVAIVAREHPPGATLLMGRGSKTTASFLVQLAVALSPARSCGHRHGPCA